MTLQHGQLPDPVAEVYRALEERIHELEEQVVDLRQKLETVSV